jgi:HlyD family secretion protein
MNTAESDTLMRNGNSASLYFLLGAGAIGAALLGSAELGVLGSAPAHSQEKAAPEAIWAAAAPGRVEPKGRELRIVAPAPAVIKEVLVGLNDRVRRGDLLVRLDDEELAARLTAVKAQVAVRTTDRDNVRATGNALDRRKAEDSVYAAERNAFDARLNLDRLITDFRANKATADEVQKARAAVAAAGDALDQEQQKLKKIQAKNLPALTREEASLSAARAEVSVLSANIERMRIRSPIDASALEVNARAGEMAGASAETALAILGDTAHLQVRAEVEERDVSKIYSGQAAIVKSEAYPNRTFDVRVSVMAKSLGAPQLSARSQRKQTDVDILEVILDLEEGAPLLPGMRVDVLFREPETMPKSSSASAN